MTNLEKWRFFLEKYPSPDLYIDFTFYGMISIALGRRVWFGPQENPLFPNMFVLLVGEPGIGKTQVIKQAIGILEQFKFSDWLKVQAIKKEKPSKKPLDEKEEILKEIEKFKRMKTAKDFKSKKHKEKRPSILADDLLFPVAPNSSTFENIVNAHAFSTRVVKVDPCVLAPQGVYVHNSLAFTLEELSSLFRKKKDDLVKYLMTAFDCGKYVYECLGRNADIIKTPCLNIIAGTTPDFLDECFKDSLVNDGFSSRTLFVCADAPRFYKFGVSEFTADQLQARDDIASHVRKLADLFGKVEYTPEAWEYLRHYFEEVAPTLKPASNLMKYYFARKNIHVQKLAAAIHFGESTELTIKLSTCEKAMEILSSLEKKVQSVISVTGETAVGKFSKRVYKFIKERGELEYEWIWLEFIKHINSGEIDEILEYLLAKNSIGKKVKKGGAAFYYAKSEIKEEEIS